MPVSFVFPMLLRLVLELSVFVVMLTVCVLYVSLRSSVTHNICGGGVFMCNIVLSICRCSLVLYSAR